MGDLLTKLKDLLESETDSREFVKQGLKALEASHRQTALGALGDWERTGIASPNLFKGLARLENPSWGGWNGLLDELRNARKFAIRENRAENLPLLEKAVFLSQVLQKRSEQVGQDVADQLGDCKQHLRYSIPDRPELKKLLELPIRMRNMIAHQAPEDQSWWEWAERSLRTIIEHALSCSWVDLVPEMPCGPWMYESDGEIFSFNGFSHSREAQYVSIKGNCHFDKNLGANVVKSIKRMTGKQDIEEQNLRRLMRTLAPEEEAGILLGDYLLQKPVGEGGFATVFKAVQISTQRKVAVKVLRDGLDDTARERFRKEAKHLSYFGGDENIVDVIGFGEEPWDRPWGITKDKLPWFESFSQGARVKSFIALEWIEGRTLEEIFLDPATKELLIETKVEWFTKIAMALRVAHAVGIVHRDVKPSNIMIDDDGRAILMDFNVARTEEAGRTIMTRSGQQLGTPAYMSPEQIRAGSAEDEIGRQSDIYSLGASFYELFTVQRIFDHDRISSADVQQKKLTHERPAFPKQIIRKLSWEVCTILMGCLESETRDRYQSADDLVTDLQRYTRNEEIAYRRPGAMRRVRLAYRRNRPVFLASAAFAILLISSTIAYTTHLSRARDAALVARQEAVIQKNQAEKLREESEKSNREIIRHLAPAILPILHRSTDLELNGAVMEFLVTCRGHLRPQFYEDSAEDSIASVQLSQQIAAAIYQEHNGAAFDESFPIDRSKVDEALWHTNNSVEIMQNMLGQKEIIADDDLVKYLKLVSDESLMMVGKIQLINGNLPEAITTLRTFDQWVEDQLGAEPNDEIKAVMFFNRFETLPALAMAYKRNGEHTAAIECWKKGS